jgi:quercetin dioxygenase-like cupin family protein
VTGHDADGRSVVISDAPAPASRSLPDATFHEIWNTAEMPASVRPIEPREPTERPLVTPPDPNGTIIRVVDLMPGSISPIHRTETIDYGIVLQGEVQLVLDDGSETPLRPGDVVIQRGTDHAWANRTAHPSRMVFVLVDGRFSEDLRASLPAEALSNLFADVLDDA